MSSVVSKSYWGKLHLPPINNSKSDSRVANVKISGRAMVVSMRMLAPRKFLQRRKKMEVFKDAADEADQKNWRRLMKEIDEPASAVSVLRSERTKSQTIPRDLVVGTLIRYKQLKRWNHVCEGNKYREAEEVFNGLLNNEKPPLKPDQKVFHMMIYMYKMAGNYEKTRKTFALMDERGIERSTSLIIA